MATTVSIDNEFVEKCLKLLAEDEAATNDKVKRYLVGYMNNEKNIQNLLNFLKSSDDDVNKSLKQLQDKDLISAYDKTRLDTLIISNISSSTASKWLPDFNSFNLLKRIIEGKKSEYVINTFLIKFLLRGLRNNNFLRTVKDKMDNLDPKIIKLLIELTTAIRITFTNTNTDNIVLTKQLKKSIKIPTDLVETIIEKADSRLLIKHSELNKIEKMQKKLDKLFKILRRDETVSSILSRNISSSYKELDKKTAGDYDLFEYLINFDDTVERLIQRTNNLELKCKELKLKSKDNVKEFSVTEFHEYLTSDNNTYFIRKYENKYYGFTGYNFKSIYYDLEEYNQDINSLLLNT